MAEDIRFSKKAATLTHASARGKVKRNAGNFTRGSQLFQHEILMTWAGIRMPLYVWVGTAILLLCVLVSLTFKNHEVQLVLMKLYAEAWGWVQLNPNKPANLTLPSGQMVQGTMYMVPYHPAVERAWAKAVQVSISAGLGAAFICVPLTVWFVDFSKRRGTDILTERHERGAVLVTHSELAQAITSHNWKAHVSECRKRRPAVDPDKILAEPLKDRVRAGLHAPYRLAGVPVPWRLEQSHAMFIGTTGAGKTTELKKIVTQARERGHRCVIFDLTGTFVESFYDAETDIILNPMDRRCVPWSIFNDCDNYAEFMSAATALVPSGHSAEDDFWQKSARTLFVEMCVKMIKMAGTHELNAEQIAAGTLALASKDRTIVIQGVAGAGKTTIISAIASVAYQEGREVIGLAFANKMVSDLRSDTAIRGSDGEVVRQGITARTVSSFVNEHLRPALEGSGPKFEASREALRGKVLVLDEASLVANKPMNDLLTIANRLGVEKLVMIGDRAQLQPIEAGKSFSLIQSDSPAIARIDTSLRQRTEHMKEAAGLARAGMFKESFASLGERVVEAGADHLKVTAQKWLELSPEDRERTAIYSSGRAARGELNRMVQQGLKAEGAIQGEGLRLTTLLPAHATREELRYAATYSKGQLLEVTRHNAPGGLVRGRYDVEGVDAKGRIVLREESGKLSKFDPAALDPSDKRDALRLSERHKETIYEGDKVRWTEKDDARGLMKSEEARILGIRDGIVTIENKAGETVELKQNDRMLERMGLAYAINMHQAQGDTRDMAIGEMHSSARHLSNQRLALVMMTRVRDDITIVTNDRDRLLAQIGRNPGGKTSALETLGEKQVEAKRGSRDAGEFRPTIPDHLRAPEDRQASASRIDPASLRATPQLDVPERNIERSR